MNTATVGVMLVILCTVIEAFAQTFFKKSALRVSGRYAWIALALTFFTIDALIYTVALRLLPVSAAFAISSLGFVTVTVLAAWLLSERVTATRWIGVALILMGVSLIVAYV